MISKNSATFLFFPKKKEKKNAHGARDDGARPGTVRHGLFSAGGDGATDQPTIPLALTNFRVLNDMSLAKFFFSIW